MGLISRVSSRTYRDMSLPGPLSRRLHDFHSKVIDMKATHGPLYEEGQYRTFVQNRLDYYEAGLKRLAHRLSENGTIPVEGISSINNSVTSTGKRSRAQRIILYGIIKRVPKQAMENMYLENETHNDMEDIVPGAWVPTLSGLGRKLGLNVNTYNYSDELIYLEDYSKSTDAHSIHLSGDIAKSKAVVTGMPVVLTGRYVQQTGEEDWERAHFDVESYKTLQLLDSVEIPELPKLPGKQVLCISGLGFGDDECGARDRLCELLSDLSDEARPYGNVTHVFIVGDLMSKKAWLPTVLPPEGATSPAIEDAVLKINASVLSRKVYNCSGESEKSSIQNEIRLAKALNEADQFLADLLEMYPVTLFSGEADGGYDKPPFTGFNRDLFTKASLYKNFRCAQGFTDAVLKDPKTDKSVQFLALSRPLKSESSAAEKMNILLAGLKHGQMVPGAPFPEVLDLYYTLTKEQNDLPDPFLIEEYPNVVLTINNSFSAGSIKKSVDMDSGEIFIQSVPEFRSTGGFSVLDLETFSSNFFVLD